MADKFISSRAMNALREVIEEIYENYEKSTSQMPSKVLAKFQRALDDLFNDRDNNANCREVLYTNNADRMFFGMCIVPIINPTNVDRILISDDPIRITDYYLEIDSRLLDPTLGLTCDELVAVVLHEVGHLVNTSVPVEKIRKEIDAYLLKNGENINIEKLSKNPALLSLGIKDAIRKVTSMFESDTSKLDEIEADSFVIACGYGEYLKSAFVKIQNKLLPLNHNVSNKFLVLIWALRTYKNFSDRRFAINQTLKKAKSQTGSTLMKREADAVIADVNKVDIREGSESNEIRSKYKFKYNILRKYEDEYYEHALRLKNANIEEDALTLVREINARISVIEEFLNTVEFTDADRARFTKLYMKYNDLRDMLSKKNIIKSKYMGLWVEYPEWD